MCVRGIKDELTLSPLALVLLETLLQMGQSANAALVSVLARQGKQRYEVGGGVILRNETIKVKSAGVTSDDVHRSPTSMPSLSASSLSTPSLSAPSLSASSLSASSRSVSCVCLPDYSSVSSNC